MTMAHENDSRGFTLVELLAVVAVIGVLAGLVLGVAKFANQRAGLIRAKAQIAAFEAALEAYKAEVGYYPVSTAIRLSGSGNAELSNSWFMFRALTQPKLYFKTNNMDVGTGSIVEFGPNQSQTVTARLPYFQDPWGRPWNYYRPQPAQQSSLAVSNVVGTWPVGPFQASSAFGGQQNPLSFDLFSFGPDGCTYIPGSSSGAYAWRWYADQTQPQHANDDINNWGR